MNAGAYGKRHGGRPFRATAVDGGWPAASPNARRDGLHLSSQRRARRLIFVGAEMVGSPDQPANHSAAHPGNPDGTRRKPADRARTGGSTFVNPPHRRAWELIDAAGCRGVCGSRRYKSEAVQLLDQYRRRDRRDRGLGRGGSPSGHGDQRRRPQMEWRSACPDRTHPWRSRQRRKHEARDGPDGGPSGRARGFAVFGSELRRRTEAGRLCRGDRRCRPRHSGAVIDQLKQKPDVVFNALHGLLRRRRQHPGRAQLHGDSLHPFRADGLGRGDGQDDGEDGVCRRRLCVALEGKTVSRAEMLKGDPLPRPYVAKPANEGSSSAFTSSSGRQRQSLCGHRLAVRRARSGASVTSRRELTCAVMGDKPMAVTELRPKSGFYDYTNKYTGGKPSISDPGAAARRTFTTRRCGCRSPPTRLSAAAASRVAICATTTRGFEEQALSPRNQHPAGMT